MQKKCLQYFGLQITAVSMFLEKRIQPHPLNHALFPSFLSVSREFLRVTHTAAKEKSQHSPWFRNVKTPFYFIKGHIQLRCILYSEK